MIENVMNQIAIPKTISKLPNPFKFVREVREELDKVEWPNRKQTAKLTGLVIGASVLVGVYIGALDWVFTYLLTFLIK